MHELLRPSRSSIDPIRTVRRLLVVLTFIAVLGPLFGAGASALTGLRTYQSLERTEEFGKAIRFFGDMDQLHDALRGDVAVAAILHAGNNVQFEEHARELEEGLRQIHGLPQPEDLAARTRALAPPLLEYVAFARRVMQKPNGPTARDVAGVEAKWHALVGPMMQLSNQMQTQMTREQTQGRRTYERGNLLRIITLTLVIGGILLVGQRIGIAVLRIGRGLSDEAETALRASRSRADFLAAMSHEIRTPMTGVLGMVDLLAAEALEPRQRTYVEGLRASGRHLLHVINDILDFTRLESGQIELERIDFSLPELLEQVHSFAHPLGVERGLRLEFRLEPHSSAVLNGDPTRIQQVLLNLVGNAIKFTERGSVTVEVKPALQDDTGLRYRFEVRDTGIGIPAESQANLFFAFRQADETISRRFGGTGLGLAICRRLVEAMGGTIGVSSVVGQGSTFFFELPLAIGSIEQRGKRDSSEREALQPRRILIAEDVEINRQILAAALERGGHQLVFAHNGAEAVEMAGSQEFDLILMDVQMPVMDGLEATRRIRALHGPNSRIAILALTANVMTHELERYLSAGMDECLTKPINWDQLFGAIGRHTRQNDHSGPNADPTPAPSQNQREAERQVEDAVEPLVNDAVISTLEGMMGRDELRRLLAVAFRSYQHACLVITQKGSAPAALGAEAHKVVGSASTLGLARIGAVAARMQAGARLDRAPTQLIKNLSDAIEATRSELVRRSLM